MMSFKDFKRSKDKQNMTTKDNRKSASMINNKNLNDKVAGPLQQISNKPILDQKGTTILDKTKETNEKQQSVSSSASISSVTSSKSTTSSLSQHSQVKMSKLFGFIGETYRDIRRCTSSLHKDLYNTHLIDTINKYKIGCNKMYEDALESYEMSFKLAQNIIRTMDLFKDMCTTYTNMEEYQHRICELMAIFITCELRLSVDARIQEQLLIGNRIVYIMRKHLVQEEEEETRYNILRTLVYIPRLFNAREIMCVIFGEFIPLKPVLKINVLTDKLYMLYIIVFYRWMKMQKDADDTQIIVNFAENFMKPSVTLCANKLYATHLPRYTTHSSATRTILNNMNFYKDIRNASIIDNALKKMGTVVNLCDDDEDDDVIIEDTCGNIDFAELFASVKLDPLDGPLTHIKLEEKTVVDTLDLTLEDECIVDSETTIRERHEKWLNSFHQLAQQSRESQILLQKQKSIQSTESDKIICLDSDSEGDSDHEEAIMTQKEKGIINKHKPTTTSEDLFMDNYPLTTTPINCESDLESSDAEDADDMTKLSSRFLPGTLRTYQVKSREKETSTETEQVSPTTEYNQNISKSADASIDIAYRRDSIHISSTPPGRGANDDDEGTDVQDEHEDDNEEEQFVFLPKATPKKIQKEILVKEIKPMGPYPTYNNLNAEKVIFSQAIPYNKEQKPKQQYLSDSSEATFKKSEQQKKRVHFNTSPLGPTSAYSSGQKYKLKPSLLQQKLQQQQHHNYKVSDAPDYFQLGGFDRFSCAPSITDSTSTAASTSTSSSLKQQQQHQEHIAAAATLFRNIFDRPRHDRMPYSYPAPFSPSSSSVSSLTSPSMETRKKPRYVKNSKSSLKLRRATICSRDIFDKEQPSGDERNSLIRNREVFNCLGPPGVPCSSLKGGKTITESSDDYDAFSDSDAIKSDRYRNDDKLRKRCAVVITPTKEILQYERKRDEMYNEILQKQRKTLELRAIEKQREKDKRRLTRDGKREQIKWNDSGARGKGSGLERNKQLREYRNYNDMFMSSESEIETHSQFRTRKQKQMLKQHIKELQPLNVQTEMTNATTSLLNEIDAHLDEPESTGKRKSLKVEEARVMKQSETNERCAKSTKMRELNLLADIAHHLSPYQLELQSNYEIQTTPPTTDQINVTPATFENVKAAVTEQLIIESLDNIVEKELDVNNKSTTTTSEHERHDGENVLQAAAGAKLPTSLGTLLETETKHQKQKPNIISNEICENSREEALEQILEESINVLKSVTSPPAAECSLNDSSDDAQTTKPNAESIIPLLISSVESLNHMELNINKNNSIPGSPTEKNQKRDKEKSPNHTNFVTEKCFRNKTNAAKELENYETENNKASSQDMNRHLNSNAGILSSTLIQSSMNVTDLCEHDISRNFRPSSLMPADISDISLESEISKNLPDIAEPSPIVTTDMSDNSMESEMSKSITETTDNSAVEVDMADLSLPDLPLVLPSIAPTPAEVDSNYNINTTLHTPTKIQLISIMDSITQQTSDSLNTPIKTGIAPELDTPVKNGLEMPVKNGLEPEADTNVTKFLDLILNKTVTDAESETRDKILRELNAITADTLAAPSLEDTETVAADKENKSNDSCAQVISAINSVVDTGNVSTDNEHNTSNSVVSAINSVETVPEVIENKSVDSVATVIENGALKLDLQSLDSPNKLLDLENKSFDSIDNESLAHAAVNASPDSINAEETNNSLDSSNLLPTEIVIGNSSQNSFNPEEIDSPAKLTVTAATNSRTSAILIHPNAEACDILSDSEKNAPKNSLEDPNTQTTPAATVIDADSEQSACNNAPSVPFKLKSPIKQIFNIKCRVRLKRLNVAKHCKAKISETWVALPLSKPEEETDAANNDEISNCDNENETTMTSSLVKKPSLKINNNNKHTEEGDIEENKCTDADDEKLLENVIKNPKIDATPEPTIIEKPLLINALSTTKTKSKSLKSVTFDLSNIHEDLRYSSSSKHKHKSKGFYMKTHRHPRKLPENTLRAAETLQLFVNTINESMQTPPPAEFNKKRSPIKNKCIAEDETPRPPLASALMGGVHKKMEKSRSSHISTSSKCKDQLVSSLVTASIPTISSDITTARIYTSSPLDQTLPEYDDNVDTVADSELILPTTTGMSSLRRKSKKPKKSLTRPEPAYDTSTDDIINQPPEGNGEEDTDAVVDNEDDVFAEELLPIPASNEHILEEIVSARTPHIGAGTAIRDDYMNIEATATVPVYLFNDESRDLATPEPIQSTCETNVVDSSSFLKTSPLATCNSANHTAAEASTKTGNLEKSMLSPSEHEVSSTQETFFQTPTKNKQNGDSSGDKVLAANKDKTNPLTASHKPQEDTNTKTKEDNTSSAGLLQNNQVDTTNHSPEMCTLTSSSSSSNRKIRKVSTHDEILFNELQQQQQQQQQKPLQQQQKRKTATTIFCAESTSNNKKIRIMSEETKANGSFGKLEDKIIKGVEDNKNDKIESVGGCVGSAGGGGSSPSTTTTINEEKISRSRRKKMKSSKLEKCKYNEKKKQKSEKKSSYSPHISANPLIITIPKSRILRPPPTPSPILISEQPTEPPIFQVTNKETDKEQNDKHQHHHSLKRDKHTSKKSKRTNSPENMVQKVLVPDDIKQCVNTEHESSNTTNNSQEMRNADEFIASSPSITPLSLTISTKKKGKPIGGTSSGKPTNNTKSLFVKDKYDLIKTKEKSQDVLEIKEKHPEHINKGKEKCLDLLKTKEKNDDHTKPSRKRNHKSLSSKDKAKDKNTEKPVTPANVLKLITHFSCNKTIMPTSNNTFTTNSSSLSSSSTSSLSPIVNKQTSSKSTKNSSDTNSSSSNFNTKLKSLSTMQTATTAAPIPATSSSMTTISTSHVRKKLKTK